jgi:hypothetical protein
MKGNIIQKFYRLQKNKAAFDSSERKPPRSGAVPCFGMKLDRTTISAMLYLFFGGRLTPMCNPDDDEKLVISLLGCATFWW